MPDPTDEQLADAVEKTRKRFKQLFPGLVTPAINVFREVIRTSIRNGHVVLLADGQLELTPAGRERGELIRLRIGQRQN